MASVYDLCGYVIFASIWRTAERLQDSEALAQCCVYCLHSFWFLANLTSEL